MAFTHRLNSTAVSIPNIDTASCFNDNHLEPIKSPIDNCLSKIKTLNLIQVKFQSITTLIQEEKDTQYNLILLGYVSAIESYIREIIRKLIILDKDSRIASENQQLNYGAALNYTSEMLPEALLENSSFASKENIIKAFKGFLGLKGHIINELDTTLSDYEIVCHLRHCVVHRFGKLGSNNAIKFGLDLHSNCLEKPLSLDEPKLFSLNQVCQNTVLVINDYLFNRILLRTIDSNIWSWDLRIDKREFVKYYELFSSNIMPPTTITNNKDTYNKLRDYRNNNT